MFGEAAEAVGLEAFMIGRYEVTNAQYRRFVSETGRLPPDHWPDQKEALDAGADRPVVGVS